MRWYAKAYDGATVSRGSGVKCLVHDMGADVAPCSVVEGLRYRANDGETQPLPKAYCTFICGYDQVELHGAKAQQFGDSLRVFAHLFGDSLSS